MRYPNLRPDLSDSITHVSAGLARKPSTRPHGIKYMGPGEDTFWEDEDGREKSVRAMDLLVGGLEEGLSTTSRFNTVSTSPAPGSADGYPEGGFWTQVDDELVEVDRWIVQDGAWAQVGLDAGRLVAGSLDVGLIDAIAMAAKLITSGAFRTAATGQRVEITTDGLTLFLVDPDGDEYEAVQIGPNGANLITVGDSRVTKDSVVSPLGAFNALTVGGRALADAITDQVWATTPRMVSIGGAGTTAANIGIAADKETGVFDVLLPAIRKDHWYRAEIELVTYPRGTDAEMNVGLRSAPISQGVNVGSPAVTDRRAGVFSGLKWDHRHVTLWFRGSQLTPVSEGGTGRLLLCIYANQRIDIDKTSTMAIYTEGRPLPFSSTINRGGVPEPGSTVVPPVPPSASVQTQTIDWWASGSTTYFTSSGAVYGNDPDSAIQGSYDGSSGNRRHTAWWFADLTSRLSGATINDVQMYARNTWTYANAGGTGHFYAHNGSNAAGANVMNAYFQRGQERWMPMPSTYWDALKNGSMRGFMCLTNSTDRNEYLRFAGGAQTACLRITYTK